MSLFKRKPPEEEIEDSDLDGLEEEVVLEEELELPDLPPELMGEEPKKSEKDAFPLPGGAHMPLPPALGGGGALKPLPRPLPPTPKSLAEEVAPEPIALPEPPEPPKPSRSLGVYEDEFEAVEAREPMDEPEPVVKGGSALDELEKLLKPGVSRVAPGGLVKIAGTSEPEILKAFVDLVGNPITISIVENLLGKELSLEEIAAQTKNPPEKVNVILQRLVCIGLVEDFWYKTPAGKHINRFKFINTTGTLDFDLKDLGNALDVQKLDEKSAFLVELVSREGKDPRSLAIKEMGLSEASHLDQIVRFTEKFKLPNVKDLITEDAPDIEEPLPIPMGMETMPLPKMVRKKQVKSGFDEEFRAIEGYMKKLEDVDK